MAMNQDLSEREAQALAWVVRVRDRDFDDWGAFEQWLETSAAHAEAYHALANRDRDLDALLPALALPADAAPQRRAGRRWAWPAIGAAVAAMLVGVVAIRMPSAPGPSLYQVATRAGERRAVALQGGTAILLNGDSVLVLDRHDARFAELKRGEALFSVRHDAAHPFAVQVGADRLVDVGTRFDVVRSGAEMRVAVADGAVVYNPDGAKLALAAGDMLRVTGNVAVRSKVAAREVGGWREGRFVYAGEPLAQVAEDLARYAGTPIAVTPELAGQPFRGVIAVADPAALAELGPLFRARVGRQGDGWLISRH